MGRRLATLVPLITVILVGYLVLVLGRERAIVGARLWGGPTDRLARWSGWVEASSLGERERPLGGSRVEVAARAGSEVRRARVELDDEGRAEVVLDFGARAPLAFDVEVRAAGAVLARGRAALTAEAWRARASRRGGYYPIAARGELSLVAAPGRGAFAVPFPSPLWVRIARAGQPVHGAELRLESEGAAIDPARVASDTRGIAVSHLAPREHVVTVRLRASASGASGELVTSIPVVPGALVAERVGDRLLILSAIERERAFVTLVSEDGRWFGARVKLSADGRGGARGELPFPNLAEERLFAVVESERDIPSAARVGWPLFESRDEPPLTLDARDALLLDGFGDAARAERERQLRVRRSALGVGLFGALVSIAIVFLTVRRDRKRLHAHLAAQVDAELEARLAPRTPLRSTLAIVLIVLGFIVVTVVMAWRLG